MISTVVFMKGWTFRVPYSIFTNLNSLVFRFNLSFGVLAITLIFVFVFFVGFLNSFRRDYNNTFLAYCSLLQINILTLRAYNSFTLLLCDCCHITLSNPTI